MSWGLGSGGWDGKLVQESQSVCSYPWVEAVVTETGGFKRITRGKLAFWTRYFADRY